jgi:putative ABC transport system permease protein
MRKGYTQSGLSVFTGRQIQEIVLGQYKTIAISSLLLLMAMSCVAYGIGVSTARTDASRTADFSANGSEEQLHDVLYSEKNSNKVSSYYPMYLANMETRIDDDVENNDSASAGAGEANTHSISWGGLMEAVKRQSGKTENLLQQLSSAATYPYLISEKSYNALLKSIGEQEIDLSGNKVAYYSVMLAPVENAIIKKALTSGAYVEIDGKKFDLLPEVYNHNVVADRKITLHNALIVPDEKYKQWTMSDDKPFCWNIRLADNFVNEKGLMQAIESFRASMETAGLSYESYLGGMGRNLFYTVAASYLTIYLGILFMIIANTFLGLKYLMQQRANEKRYRILLMLGAGIQDICSSVKKQIRLYFTLVLCVAVCSSVFAIIAMFNSFLKLPEGASISSAAGFSALVLTGFAIIECIYIRMVERASVKEIRKLSMSCRG